jgi:hypothetical protein
MKKMLDTISFHFNTIWVNANDWLNKKNRHELIVWTFFLGYLFIGYQIYDDYGISMDEPIQRKHGMVSLEYVNRQLGEPFNIPNIYNIDVQYYDHKDYGVIFQMGCYALELLLDLKDSRDIFLLRHALVFLLFWVSVVYFYKLLEYHFKDWRLALLGAAFLVLSPRIFANAFYNPKDIPLLSWCIISTYTMLKFLDLRNFKYAFLHGFACAMAINTRIVGVYIPVITIGFYLLDRFKSHRWLFYRWRNILSLALFLSLLVLFTIAFWPFLWHNTIQNFVYAFSSMSQFRWFNTIFFMGEYYYPQELPWYYILMWILISTPMAYFILFLVGLLGVIFNSLKNYRIIYSTNYQRNTLIFLSFLATPLIAVIFLNSTLYNGWRHLYFIYPFLLLFSINGIKFLLLFIESVDFHQFESKIGLVCMILFTTLLVGYSMHQMHPFQNVFFNSIVLKKSGDLFELDYYGLSFRYSLEELLKLDSDTIKVAFSSSAGVGNTYILPHEDKVRIQISVPDSANYFISNNQRNIHPFDSNRNDYHIKSENIIGKTIVQNNAIIKTYLVNKSEERR